MGHIWGHGRYGLEKGNSHGRRWAWRRRTCGPAKRGNGRPRPSWRSKTSDRRGRWRRWLATGWTRVYGCLWWVYGRFGRWIIDGSIVNGIHEPSGGNHPAGMRFWCVSSQHLWAMELSATEQTSTAWFSWGYSIIFHISWPWPKVILCYTILIYIVLWCFIPMLGTGTPSESLKTSWRASFSVLGRRQGVNLKLRVASKMLRSALKCLARTKPLLCGFMGHPGYWPATKLVWDMWVQNSMTGGDVFS